MSKVRVLVGTRKGAFVLTSDGKREKWDVSGPHFAGWEIYHVKGSPADPNRLYASQSSGWFGQLIQRSNDGGKTWEPVGNKFVYDGVPGHAPVVRRHAAPVGVQTRLAPRAVARPIRTQFTPAWRTPRCSASTDGGKTWHGTSGTARPRHGSALAAGRGRHVPAHDPSRSERTPSACTSPSRRRARSAPTTAARPGGRSTAGCSRELHPRPRRRGRPLRPPHRHAPVAPGRAVHAEALGRDAQRRRRRLLARGERQPADRFRISSSTFTRTSRRRSTSCRSRATREHFPLDGKLRVYRSRTGGNEWEPLTKGLPQSDCYVNVLRDAMAVDSLDPCGVYFGTTGGQVYCSRRRGRHLDADRARPSGGALRGSADAAA